MLRRMSAKDFRGWEIYAGLEPFGEVRADHRAAQVAQMVFNMAVAAKHRKPLKDFILPTIEYEEASKPRQDTFAVMKILAAAYSTDTTPSEGVAVEKEDRVMMENMKEQMARARAALINVS